MGKKSRKLKDKSSRTRERGSRHRPQAGQDTILNSSVFKVLTSTWWAGIIIAAVALIIYSNIFQCPFVFDDVRTIVENEKFHDLSYFGSIRRMNSSRVLVFFTLALNYHFGQLNVFGYHLINIFIHIAASLTVYFLCRLLFKQMTEFSRDATCLLSLSSALIFAAHPLQTQAVTYTIQRVTSLVTLFYMASVLCYVKARIFHRDSRASGSHSWLPYCWYGVCAISGMLAMLCKQNAASLPGAILLVEYLCFNRSWTAWKRKIPWFTVFFLAWAVLALSTVQAVQLGDSGSVKGFIEQLSDKTVQSERITRWQYLCTEFNVLVKYLQLLLLPVGQNHDHHYHFKKTFFDGLTPLALTFLISLVAAGVYFRKQHPIVTFFIGWYFITLSIESSIFPLSDAMFEHRLYLPMLGYGMFFAYLVYVLSKKQLIKTTYILAVVILALSAATYTRNIVWQDDVRLWSDSVSKNPRNFRAYKYLGRGLYFKKRYPEAIESYKKAIQIKPTFQEVHNDIGVAYFAQGKWAEAAPYFKKAAELDPTDARTFNNLGSALFASGNPAEAIIQYRKALEIDPRNTDALKNLAAVYYQEKQYDLAVHYGQQAHKLGVKLSPQVLELLKKHSNKD